MTLIIHTIFKKKCINLCQKLGSDELNTLVDNLPYVINIVSSLNEDNLNLEIMTELFAPFGDKYDSSEVQNLNDKLEKILEKRANKLREERKKEVCILIFFMLL